MTETIELKQGKIHPSLPRDFIHCCRAILSRGYMLNLSACMHLTAFIKIKKMALYYNLPVYAETYRFLILIYKTTSDFPRDYKYTIGQDLKKDVMQLIKLLYRANRETDKASVLLLFVEDFELVKLQLRICFDLKLISTGTYSKLIIHTESIGKQISGWLKSASRNIQN